MAIRLRAEDEPARTRADSWQHTVGSSLASYQLHACGDTLRSEICQAQIGTLTVLDFQMSALEAARTPDLISKSDRGLVKIDLGIRGQGRYEQDDRQNLLTPGEFHLANLSRPSHVAIDDSQEIAVVIFPRALFPLRDRDLRELTTVGFPSDDPHASLVASLGRELAVHLDAYDSARDARISEAFLSLLSLAIATRLDRVDSVPYQTRQQGTLARIRAFIDQHLADPELSPTAIAAAHHISIRTLHKLWEPEERTVTASIRRRRLERCREDLLDHDRPGRPVSAVGAHW